ncbi:NADPH-dependent oxidoreductase [Pediococcus pentosaceus]|uniref:NADPH-dependent oxidoreductase n=1 Tax=Pediococcus pentosaceus TaxID=1255 RepID=UPI002361E729|nr:NADPH-dependent oxidoreductase [Pediococcus pentosaceus]MDD1387425.1 NADPH-dependent oxidoreductase [Pediococcus pentosaceus]
MKLVAIAGSIGEQSYNRMLLQYIAKHFENLVDIELLNIDDVPVFNEDEDLSDNIEIQKIYQKVYGADGVILATPEHNHTVTAAIKNVIEWLSFKLHPFDGKPVWIVGASYFNQGSSRAQLHLKQILEAPGVNAIVMPGNEFLLRNAKEAFDAEGQLKDTGTVQFLEMVIQKFIKFVKVIDMLDAPDPKSYQDEDLESKGKVNTTIEGVDMHDEHWVEKAAQKVHAVDGSTYVKLDRGILTVDQLNYFLKTMPVELTYADDNNQFIYYNKNQPADKMLAPRNPGQAGDPLADVHPVRAVDRVKQVIHALRTGETDLVSMPVPGNGPDRHVMHYYKAMRDENGRYRGVNEWVTDIMPIIKYYLASTGQKLIKDPAAKPISPITGIDVMAGASANPEPDVTSGASEEGPAGLDVTSGASETPESNPEVDATSGASEV